MQKTEIIIVIIDTQEGVGIPKKYETVSVRIFSINILPMEYRIKYIKNTPPRIFFINFLKTKNNNKNTPIFQKDSYKNVG